MSGGHMNGPSNKLQTGLIGLLAMSLFVGPAIGHATSSRSVEYFSQPFSTLSPQEVTFTAPFTATPPIATPIPTLGPGQYFEKDDQDRPEIAFIEGGDEKFGYGPLADDGDLYTIWATDETGTHYLIVERDSDYLVGSESGLRGYRDFIADRDPIARTIEITNTSRRSHDRTAETFAKIGFPILVAGAVVCEVVSFGACSPIIALGAGFLIPAFSNQQNARGEDDLIEVYNMQLEGIEDQLVGKFNQTENALAGP